MESYSTYSLFLAFIQHGFQESPVADSSRFGGVALSSLCHSFLYINHSTPVHFTDDGSFEFLTVSGGYRQCSSEYYPSPCGCVHRSHWSGCGLAGSQAVFSIVASSVRSDEHGGASLVPQSPST